MRSPRWYLREIDAGKKREKKYRDKGVEVLDIYAGKKQNAFNILYTNTETLLPALYSAVPKPVVERRYRDDDPLGKASSEAAQRCLSFLLDTNVEGYETFDEGVRSAVLDGCLPGRGVTAVHYDASLVEGVKKSELVCLNAIAWDKVYFGSARKWSEVPWVCYEFELDKDEAEELLGNLPEELKFTNEKGEEPKEGSEEAKSQVLTATIYKLQDKRERKVLFLSDQVKDKFLKVVDDPLGITGFFDCPKPLMFLEKNELTPSALYSMYEIQAKELNRIQVRINRIVEAIKARGVYDSSLGDEIAKVLSEDDNALVPSDKTASLAAEGGLQNALWMLPLEQLVAAAQQLYQARESTKQVIFEIIGLADIMRGASNASETLGAQQIKQQWGSLRLKRLQKEVMRYVRDCLRMMLEVAATKFSEDTWAKMTGLPYLTQQQVSDLKMQLQGAMQMQPPPMPGQPPSPQVQQLQQQLQAPTWEAVLNLLRDDVERSYRIDIETNSTLDPEATEDQKQVGELLNGIGQAMNGIGPLVQNGTLPFDAAKGVMMMVTRKFQMGKEVEDYFAKMQQPQQPDPAAAEKEKQAAEVQKEQAKAQADAAKAQADAQVKQAELAKQAQVESAQAQADAAVEMKKQEEETKRFEMELAMKERVSKAEIQAKKDIAKNECQMKRELAVDQTREQIRGQKAMKMLEMGKVVDESSGEEVTEESLLETVRNLVAGIVPTIEQAIQQSQATVQAQIDALAAEVRTVHPIEMMKGADGLTSHVKRGDKVIPIVRKSIQ